MQHPVTTSLLWSIALLAIFDRFSPAGPRLSPKRSPARHEHVAAVLGEAHPGAPWRTTLGLPEPSPRLGEAIDSLDRAVRAATPSGGPPAFDALLAAANVEAAGESTLDGLVRRVLLSMLEERITRHPAQADAPRRSAIR